MILGIFEIRKDVWGYLKKIPTKNYTLAWNLMQKRKICKAAECNEPYPLLLLLLRLNDAKIFDCKWKFKIRKDKKSKKVIKTVA